MNTKLYVDFTNCIGAIGLGSGFFNGEDLDIGITRVRCTGAETSLDQCSFDSNIDSCQHHAGVICRGTNTHSIQD